MRKLMKNLGVAPENSSLLLTVYYALFSSGVVTIMLGTLLPYIRTENSLSYSQSGLLLSAHHVGYIAAVLVSGILPYAIGRKKTTLLLCSGVTIGVVLMTFVHAPWLLVLAFIVAGIGGGAFTNISNAVTAEVSGNRVGGLNLLHASYAVGALIAPIIVYVLTYALGGGWKPSALAGAALTAAAWVLIARSRLSKNPSRREKGGTLSFLKSGFFWINVAVLFFYLCAETSITGWFVIYFEDTGILTPEAAKLTPTLLWTMMMIGRLSCSALSSRVSGGKLLLALAIAFLLFFTALMFSRSAAACMAALAGIGLSMAGIYPTTLSAMRGTMSTASVGFAISIASTGGILMPGIVGAIADLYGLTGGVATIIAALAGLVALAVAKLIMDKRTIKEITAE